MGAYEATPPTPELLTCGNKFQFMQRFPDRPCPVQPDHPKTHADAASHYYNHHPTVQQLPPQQHQQQKQHQYQHYRSTADEFGHHLSEPAAAPALPTSLEQAARLSPPAPPPPTSLPLLPPAPSASIFAATVPTAAAATSVCEARNASPHDDNGSFERIDHTENGGHSGYVTCTHVCSSSPLTARACFDRPLMSGDERATAGRCGARSVAINGRTYPNTDCACEDLHDEPHEGGFVACDRRGGGDRSFGDTLSYRRRLEKDAREKDAASGPAIAAVLLRGDATMSDACGRPTNCVWPPHQQCMQVTRPPLRRPSSRQDADGLESSDYDTVGVPAFDCPLLEVNEVVHRLPNCAACQRSYGSLQHLQEPHVHNDCALRTRTDALSSAGYTETCRKSSRTLVRLEEGSRCCGDAGGVQGCGCAGAANDAGGNGVSGRCSDNSSSRVPLNPVRYHTLPRPAGAALLRQSAHNLDIHQFLTEESSFVAHGSEKLATLPLSVEALYAASSHCFAYDNADIGGGDDDVTLTCGNPRGPTDGHLSIGPGVGGGGSGCSSSPLPPKLPTPPPPYSATCLSPLPQSREGVPGGGGTNHSAALTKAASPANGKASTAIGCLHLTAAGTRSTTISRNRQKEDGGDRPKRLEDCAVCWISLYRRLTSWLVLVGVLAVLCACLLYFVLPANSSNADSGGDSGLSGDSGEHTVSVAMHDAFGAAAVSDGGNDNSGYGGVSGSVGGSASGNIRFTTANRATSAIADSRDVALGVPGSYGENRIGGGVGSGALSVVPTPTDLIDRPRVIVVHRRNAALLTAQLTQLTQLLEAASGNATRSATGSGYDRYASNVYFPTQLISSVQPSCTPSELFGYGRGEPCVAVAFQPLPTFVPIVANVVGDVDHLPPLSAVAAGSRTASSVSVAAAGRGGLNFTSSVGAGGSDAGSVGGGVRDLLSLDCVCENRRSLRIGYAPFRGYPLRFFPRPAGSTPLLVMLRFEDVPLKTELRISCALSGALNVDSSTDRVDFQILIV